MAARLGSRCNPLGARAGEVALAGILSAGFVSEGCPLTGASRPSLPEGEKCRAISDAVVAHPFRGNPFGCGGNTGKVSRQVSFLKRWEAHSRAVLQDQGAITIPFHIVESFIAFRQRSDCGCFHRFNQTAVRLNGQTGVGCLALPDGSRSTCRKALSARIRREMLFYQQSSMSPHAFLPNPRHRVSYSSARAKGCPPSLRQSSSPISAMISILVG